MRRGDTVNAVARIDTDAHRRGTDVVGGICKRIVARGPVRFCGVLAVPANACLSVARTRCAGNTEASIAPSARAAQADVIIGG